MPEPIMSNVSGAFGYQFHQVALFTEDPQSAVEFWKALGYHRWISDSAVLNGLIWTGEHWTPSQVSAEMHFNYDIAPFELEYLKYHSGLSRHSFRREVNPFISHTSVYVDDVIEQIERLGGDYNLSLPYHRFVTQAHTNPGVVGKKRFIEAIFDTRAVFGHDLKLIQKVPWDFDDSSYLEHEIWSSGVPQDPKFQQG